MNLHQQQQRLYVTQAVEAARTAIDLYKALPRVDAELLASFAVALAEVEKIAARHERGETTLSAAVYPARKLATEIELATHFADDLA